MGFIDIRVNKSGLASQSLYQELHMSDQRGVDRFILYYSVSARLNREVATAVYY